MKKTLLMFVLAIIVIPQTTFAQPKVANIAAPNGFKPVDNANKSYAAFLRNQTLKKENKVQLWNGSYLADSYYDSIAVVDMPLLFEEDLEQCADYTMRFWAEYLKSINALEQLSLYDFNGRKKPFSKANKTFEQYLRWHMAYSNSYSIKKGAEKVSVFSELKAGDMIVQNDSQEGIGHVSLVVDEAQNEFGHSVFLVGYSYMPAQEFHIERANEDFGIDGWFTSEGYKEYAKQVFGNFGKPQVMRFAKTN